jgi:hypothetical protein
VRGSSPVNTKNIWKLVFSSEFIFMQAVCNTGYIHK